MYLLSRGTGYPVLFIHGIPTSGQLWNGVMDKLDFQYTCMAIDLPGMGRSPKVEHGLKQLESVAEQIEQIRIENQIKKWHVVGHAAGSAIAVHYAFRFQERVDRLALLSPALFPEVCPLPLLRVMRKPVIGELLAPLVNSIIWNVAMRRAVQHSEGFTDTVSDFRGPFSGARGAWRMMSMLRWGNPEVALAAVPEMLRQLTIPTLIFHGAQDKAVPESFARRASDLIAHSKLVNVDSGHFIPLNSPDVVAAELLTFFGPAAQA